MLFKLMLLLLVFLIRGHMIFRFCRTVVPVFKMAQATNGINELFDHCKAFPENCCQGYDEDIGRLKHLDIGSLFHWTFLLKTRAKLMDLFNNYEGLMKVTEGCHTTKWSQPGNKLGSACQTTYQLKGVLTLLQRFFKRGKIPQLSIFLCTVYLAARQYKS